MRVSNPSQLRQDLEVILFLKIQLFNKSMLQYRYHGLKKESTPGFRILADPLSHTGGGRVDPRAWCLVGVNRELRQLVPFRGDIDCIAGHLSE